MVEPNASKLRVFGCKVFAKVLNQLRHKFGEKAFRVVIVGYPSNAPGYRVYNRVTRRVTTSEHVMFQEMVPGFHASCEIDSLISDDSDAADGSAKFLLSNVISPHTMDIDNGPPLPCANLPSRLRSHPISFGEYVANLSAYLPVFVTTCRDPQQGKEKEEVI
jgi:hypothetical protein